MKLKILGSVSPYPKNECNGPGYLITNNEDKILLDCGSGISRLLDYPSDLENLTVIISHLHKDHYSDLAAIGYASYVYHNLGQLQNRIKVYIPHDEIIDYIYLKMFDKENYLDFIGYKSDCIINISDITISFKPTKHQLKTYAIKVSDSNNNIVYSADTGYDESLIPFFNNADILLCESTFLNDQKNNNEYHLSTHDAATLAKKSKVRKLVLTHFWPEIKKEEYVNEAKKVFNNTEAAVENNIYIIN